MLSRKMYNELTADTKPETVMIYDNFPDFKDEVRVKLEYILNMGFYSEHN